MGWRDAPVVEDSPQESTKFLQAPEVSGRTGPPPIGAVAANAIAKGEASLLDMFANLPTNVYNLGKVAFGAAAYALGYKDIGDNVTLAEPPDFFQKSFREPILEVGGKELIGPLIRQEAEPQTGPQRVLDTALQAGVGMAAAPSSSLSTMAKNIGFGVTSGAAGAATFEATDSRMASLAVSLLTPVSVRAALNRMHRFRSNAVLGQTLKEGIEAGYAVPPADIKPTFLAQRLSSIGGKAALNQEASLRNQQITNRLAARALGLSDDVQVTEASIANVRQTAGQAYAKLKSVAPGGGLRDLNVKATTTQPVADVPQRVQRLRVTKLNVRSSRADSPVEELKQARHDAQVYYKHYDRSADPSSLAKAKELHAKAARIESELEDLATKVGQPELVTELRQARTLISRTYDVERAYNFASGHVDAHIIGRMLDQGRPLTGELNLIGRFAMAFPRVTREASTVPAPGVTALEPFASAALGAGGFGLAGPPGLALMAIPFVRGPARSGMLSSTMQRRLLSEPPTVGSTTFRSLAATRGIQDALSEE